MPYYTADVDIYIEQDWIDDNASDGAVSEEVRLRVEELIHKIETLKLYEDRTALDVLKEIRELIY